MNSPPGKPHVQISSEPQSYALIDKDDVVVNVIVADAEFIKHRLADVGTDLRAIRLPAHPSIGWIYKNGRFEPPVSE